MNSVLVIVESPGKIKKIEEYLNLLGDFKYIVKASYGHCRDLDPKSLSIDIDNNFAPNYKIIAELESELYDEINKLGVGPMGVGGQTTCLAVKINYYPMHIASLPVAINIQCHSARHTEVEL